MRTARRARAMLLATIVVVVVLVMAFPMDRSVMRTTGPVDSAAPVALPPPDTEGRHSLEETLLRRRSVRSFTPEELTAAQLGQLLWAAQGVTDGEGRRTAPSAGRTYPLEVSAVTADGVFRYLPGEHALRLVRPGDARPALAAATWDQPCVRSAPTVVVIAAVEERTEERYGPRAARYIALEAGHVAQNVLLQAVALGLAGVPVGSFDDARLPAVVGLAEDEAPLYLLSVGHPR